MNGFPIKLPWTAKEKMTRMHWGNVTKPLICVRADGERNEHLASDLDGAAVIEPIKGVGVRMSRGGKCQGVNEEGACNVAQLPLSTMMEMVKPLETTRV